MNTISFCIRAVFLDDLNVNSLLDESKAIKNKVVSPDVGTITIVFDSF